ncbi:glyceraldehyde-3-phosphate dehydrogenase, type I [Vittaforma corneae ATCC 50505]|uniref:glyceraldehyde-3-phosphate dehydrogenase (phosphorylating) n=1 Tax=Vittaforma corneae (strain ATCC 50505) TaxID=993615 RepID=L2GNS7_VITCO|nr:glyceraldehyde-3-phosphate dehydrogenase, type I [Vittaforma corneae ATCC 50505]ELA41977.1 glyceraldehyde-3-phosphate dehydrogenase, type I [Vittaforma corneae ATCC 50505]
MIVGINGFGRIGKQVYRILVKNGVNVALVNDPFVDIKYFYYLAKFDSVYGTLEDIQQRQKSVIAHGIETFLSNESEPENINWPKYNVNYVIECSGKFTTHLKCSKHNCERVILSCPSSDIPTFVFGVNHELISNERVISAASCTTNCLAPIVKVLNDRFGIVEGLVTTVHSLTGSQKTVDSKGSKWRSSRGCMNIIPATTGATMATEMVIPEIKGRITGSAYRVPVSDVSVVDFV